VAHDLGAGHVRHQAPLDLHHRHARIRRDVAHVRAEGELEAAAEGDAMHGGDHRHGQFTPAPHRILRAVGGAVGARLQLARHGGFPIVLAAIRALAGHLAEVAHVEAGAEGPAFARQHDNAHGGVPAKGFDRLDQRVEHGVIERVHLVGAHKLHVGDAVSNVDRDTPLHDHGSSGSAVRSLIRRVA